MPIFNLVPVVAMLEEGAWANSRVKEPCWVHAADEAEARGMASGRFQDAAGTVPGQPSLPSPWRDERLVAASQVDEAPGGQSLPYGTVMGGLQA